MDGEMIAAVQRLFEFDYWLLFGYWCLEFGYFSSPVPIQKPGAKPERHLLPWTHR